MKTTLRVFGYEFRRQGRRPAFLFMTIGIPILAIVIFYGIQLYQRVKPADAGNIATSKSAANVYRPIGVVDEAGILKGSAPLMSNLILFPSQDEASAAVRDFKIASYFVIEKDFPTTGNLSMYFDRFNFGSLYIPSLQNWIVESLISNQNVSTDQVNRLEHGPTITPHNVTVGAVKQTNNSDLSFLLAYVFSIVLLITSFATSGYLMQSVVEEKESRMIEILFSSLRPMELLAGKIGALGLLGIVQMIAWGAAVFYIFKQLPSLVPDLLALQLPGIGQLTLIAMYFVLGYLMFATFYASIGALATNMREGPQLAVFITLPAVIPMYFLQLIASAPNGPLAVILSIFPITAPITMVSRLSVTDVPFGELAISLILLMLTILGAIWLAGRLFRVNTLLSGHMPKLSDIPRLIMQG